MFYVPGEGGIHYRNILVYVRDRFIAGRWAMGRPVYPEHQKVRSVFVKFRSYLSTSSILTLHFILVHLYSAFGPCKVPGISKRQKVANMLPSFRQLRR